LYQDSDYKGRDKEFAGRHNTWNAQEIAKNESKVLCAMGFHSFTALIDMKPEPGGRYIHSASEPYNEEQEISQERINAWMDSFWNVQIPVSLFWTCKKSRPLTDCG
jgi:hypothetical protein